MSCQELGQGQDLSCPVSIGSKKGEGPVGASCHPSLSQSPAGQRGSGNGAVGKSAPEGDGDSVACPGPSCGPLPRSLRPCPPGPKGTGYLTPGCLAAAVPGRGVGIWPEVALAREWRHGWGRLQGGVGFGEGRPRRAGFLRRREARALGGQRSRCESRRREC